MSEVVIRASNLGKVYQLNLPNSSHDTLRDAIAHLVKAPFRRSTEETEETSFWALRDVSFEIKRGEVVGIIGKNGAGKSTLLKILSRITEPTEGKVEIHGRVGSLLEVGTGFHPELSGRENIYLNGAILGMSKQEIQNKFDEIVAFAEIDKFIDTPVKHYSSGMYVRLAFAVAAHLEPEILLIDEVLSVGDASFQKKCLGKMDDAARSGKTVLFVTHNMAAIQNLCPLSILLEKGRIGASGETKNVIESYLSIAYQREFHDLASRQDREGSGIVHWQSVSFHRANGQSTSVFLTGEDLVVRIQYQSRALPSDGHMLVCVTVKDRFDQVLFLCSNELTGEIEKKWPESGEIACKIPRLPLVSGTYGINLFVCVNGIIADWVRDAGYFQVQNADYFGTGRLPPPTHGSFLVPHSWTIDKFQSVAENPSPTNSRR